MYQTIITLLLTAGMTSHSQAITFDEAIKHGTNTGLIRFGYISLDPDVAGNPKFVVTLALGHFEDSSKTTNTDETDLILRYNTSEKLNLELIHAMLDNKGNPTDVVTNFTRPLARLTYTF